MRQGKSLYQQATRRAGTDPGATLEPGRLSGSQGVKSFLKDIVRFRTKA